MKEIKLGELQFLARLLSWSGFPVAILLGLGESTKMETGMAYPIELATRVGKQEKKC